MRWQRDDPQLEFFPPEQSDLPSVEYMAVETRDVIGRPCDALSRRTVAYYDGGARPIPRTVALAVRALELGL